jgi:cytochrome c-type biogenesis protein CcmH/NrfF
MLSICEMQGCHSATPMRKEVREKLAEGESKEAILASFVDRFGLIVLSAPPTSGFHLSAWMYIAKRVLASWKRQTAETDAGPPPPEISGEQQARIERELKDF